MSPIFQKLLLSLTILFLLAVVIVPAFMIIEEGTKPDVAVAMYISMFPPVSDTSPADLLGHSFVRSAGGNVTMLPAKDVSARGYQIGTTVNIIYLGGRDDAKLDSIVILVQKSGGQAFRQSYAKPTVNEKYPFPNMGTDGLDNILVTGTFRDGSEQILLMTEV